MIRKTEKESCRLCIPHGSLAGAGRVSKPTQAATETRVQCKSGKEGLATTSLLGNAPIPGHSIIS